MRAYRHRHVITLDETSMVGNAYFAHYVHWQGHCRERFLADHAPGVVRALQQGTLALVTVSCHMDYYEECNALDVIDIDMTLGAASGNRATMDFRFEHDGRLVAEGSQTIASMSRTPDGMRPIPLPPELTTALTAFVSPG